MLYMPSSVKIGFVILAKKMTIGKFYDNDNDNVDANNADDRKRAHFERKNSLSLQLWLR